MAIEFRCNCGREISTGNVYAGRRIYCPDCRATLTVPFEQLPGDELGDVLPSQRPDKGFRSAKRPARSSLQDGVAWSGLVVGLLALLVGAFSLYCHGEAVIRQDDGSVWVGELHVRKIVVGESGHGPRATLGELDDDIVALELFDNRGRRVGRLAGTVEGGGLIVFDPVSGDPRAALTAPASGDGKVLLWDSRGNKRRVD